MVTQVKQVFAKTFVILFVGSLLFIAFAKAYNKWVDGFYLKNIFITTPYNSEWDISYSQQEQENVKKILNQPFYYLAKGRQSYSFVSEDGNYVLKFIKCQRIKVPEICTMSWLPEFVQRYRERKEKEKYERLVRLFTSYSLAKKVLSAESGVIYAHLNPTPCGVEHVKLYNKIGMEYTLDISQVPFAIQKKAEMIFPTFESLLAAKDEEKVKARINQIINSIVCRAHKGISDVDSSWIVRNNVGFLQDQAVHVDIGTFAIHPSTNSKKGIQEEFRKLTPLAEWLEQRDPQLKEYLKQKVAQAIEEF